MFLERPHPLYHGVCISRTEYICPGEKSLDGNYKPFHIVVYFRYARFYPDGTLIFATLADEPLHVVSRLNKDHSMASGIMRRHYRIHGSKIVSFVSRTNVTDSNHSNRRRNSTPALHFNAAGSDPNPDLRMHMYLEDDEAFDIMEEHEVLDIKTKPRRKLMTLWNNVVRRLRSRV